jgi:hypothetical protein
MKTISVESVTVHPMSYTPQALQTMSLSQLARIVKKDWVKVYYGAVPYLDALGQMDNVNQNYGHDSGSTVVCGFLSNCGTYRGETARLIKAELKRRVGVK